LTLQQIGDPLAVRAWSRAARAKGKRIGFVPTMGYLHEGHLRLVDRARQESDLVVMSIFVNPLQFGPKEDLASYPRDLARDRAMAGQRGVECLFVPDNGSMYPEPPLVRVTPGDLAAHLCGPWRPGHFEGVLTVVAKLFHIVEPDVAVFGRKDVQQARMIVRMVNDLHFPLSIVVAPTMREADGLAMSSRNTYLNPAERHSAVQISRALDEAHRLYQRGTREASSIVRLAKETIAREAAIKIQYVEAVDPVGLQPVTRADDETILAVAAYVGKTRLIDNIPVGVGLAIDERMPVATGVA
jgi:pantoate--beta-alanine ligase